MCVTVDEVNGLTGVQVAKKTVTKELGFGELMGTDKDIRKWF